MINLLQQRYYTYLCYDQKANNTWVSPGPKNNAYFDRLMKDAQSLAEIAVKEMAALGYIES